MREPFQFLWIGKELSKLEQLSLTSFLYHGHAVHLYVYDDVEGIPDGVQVEDANTIVPAAQVYKQRAGKHANGKGSLAGFSNRFRMELLRQKGGYWADIDLICMQPFDFDDDVVFGRESTSVINGALVRAPLGHELPQLLCPVFEAPCADYPWDSDRLRRRKRLRRLTGRTSIESAEFGQMGYKLFTSAVEYLGLSDLAKPYTWFYPVHWSNWRAIFDSTLANDASLFSHTYILHLWNEMLRREPGFDKNADFPKDSLIEQLKARYGV